MMIVYEVNQEIEPAAFDEFKKWFSETHVPEMLSITGFIEARILVNEDESDNKKRTTCCYLMRSRDSYDQYTKNHSAEMTRRLNEKFGSRVRLSRRVFSILQTISSNSH
jgi:hypothetical protein